MYSHNAFSLSPERSSQSVIKSREKGLNTSTNRSIMGEIRNQTPNQSKMKIITAYVVKKSSINEKQSANQSRRSKCHSRTPSIAPG